MIKFNRRDFLSGVIGTALAAEFATSMAPANATPDSPSQVWKPTREEVAAWMQTYKGRIKLLAEIVYAFHLEDLNTLTLEETRQWFTESRRIERLDGYLQGLRRSLAVFNGEGYFHGREGLFGPDGTADETNAPVLLPRSDEGYMYWNGWYVGRIDYERRQSLITIAVKPIGPSA